MARRNMITTYQWLAIAGVLVTMIFGTLLTSVITGIVLWVKTKGLVDLRQKIHGERLGGLEKKMEAVITNTDCSKCRKENERLGEFLINKNDDDHDKIFGSIDKLYSKTNEISDCVTGLAGRFDTYVKKITHEDK
jgi:hypothetical protein